MDQKENPFLNRIRKVLPLVERVAVVLFIISLLLHDINEYSSALTGISLSALAIVFFLTSYLPIEIPEEDQDTAGFNKLFTFRIGPKVSWIACSVSAIGLQFYFGGLEGADTMVSVGGTTLVLINFLLGIQFLRGIKYVEKLIPIFFRSVPIMLFDIYVMIRLSQISF